MTRTQPRRMVYMHFASTKPFAVTAMKQRLEGRRAVSFLIQILAGQSAANCSVSALMETGGG